MTMMQWLADKFIALKHLYINDIMITEQERPSKNPVKTDTQVLITIFS